MACPWVFDAEDQQLARNWLRAAKAQASRWGRLPSHPPGRSGCQGSLEGSRKRPRGWQHHPRNKQLRGNCPLLAPACAPLLPRPCTRAITPHPGAPPQLPACLRPLSPQGLRTSRVKGTSQFTKPVWGGHVNNGTLKWKTQQSWGRRPVEGRELESLLGLTATLVPRWLGHRLDFSQPERLRL